MAQKKQQAKKEKTGNSNPVVICIAAVLAVALIIAAVKLGGANKKLAAATAQLKTAQATIAQQQTLLAAKPPLPVSTALSTPGQYKNTVVFLTNTNVPQPLTVTATLSNPAPNKPGTYVLNINPGAKKSFGHAQGLIFNHGDRITFHNDSYSDVTVVIP